MDNLDKKKIHINPDFLTKRGETQQQSRVHVNPAFFAKSRLTHGIQQPSSVCTTATVLNPSVQNVNSQSHFSSKPMHQHLQAQNDKNFASSSSLTMNKQYFPSQISNKNLLNCVPNSSNSETMYFHTSKSQPLTSKPITSASGSLVQNWNYQSDLNSCKLSTYTWKADPSQPNKFSVAPSASRSSKFVDCPKTFRSSKFRYQSQDNYFSKQHLVAGSSTPKHSENKFKIDNRNNGLVVKPMKNDAPIKSENVHESKSGKSLDVNAGGQSDPIMSASKSSGNEDSKNDLQSIISSQACATSDTLKFKTMMKKSEDNFKKVKVESKDLTTAKYNVISRTKLVRRRSKSISKDKTKVNVSKGKPAHPCLVTVCRPSPKFPTRSPYQWGKIHPKKRYAVLSRTKLIRRLSSSAGDDTKDIPQYTVKTRTKLIKKKCDCNQNGADANKNYVLLSSTKLIRKETALPASVAPSQSATNKLQNDIIIRRHKLVRNVSVKTGNKYGCERSEPKLHKSTNSLYKIVNKSFGLSVKQKAARGIISKYKINRLKSDVPAVRMLQANRDVVSKYRINRLRAGASVWKKQKNVLGSASKYRLNRITVGISFANREKPSKGVISKYRINRLKSVRGIVSKYRINRLKPVSAAVLKTTSRRFKWIATKDKLPYSNTALKSSTERFSDRIINIGGILYKATRTSLKKQLAKKKYLSNESNVRPMGSKCIVKLHGYQYYLSATGKTLMRVIGASSPESAPQLSRVHIGGLTYSRTKAGQYELTKAHQARAVLSSAKHRSMVLLAQRRKRGTLQKRNQYCIFFNRFGRCTKKEKGECPYLHDLKRVAVCTRFLRGRCPVDNCPFSHEIDPNKMPVCSHFVRSTCTREKCPYRHVKVSARAPLCLDFLHGYCPLAEECKKQHLLECEEFSKTGKCPRGESCPLSHRKGKRQKKKSVSLEPASISDNKLISLRQTRKRKTSEPADVLGDSNVKKVGRPQKLKKSSVSIKRYFHVSDLEDKKCLLEEENASKEIPVTSDKNLVKVGKCPILSEKGTCPEITEVNSQFIEENNHGNSLDLTQVRKRVLKKVGNLKKAYLHQEGQDFSFHQNIETNKNDSVFAKNCKILNIEKICSNLDADVEGNTNNKKDKVENAMHIYTNERRPLPKRLPSYIPLCGDSKDVEDL